MVVEAVNEMAGFESALRGAGERLVVVDFYADWCGPCRAIAPKVHALSEQHARSCVFLKVNVDVARDVAAHCAVRAMPTFHFYLRGSKVDDFAGADPNRLEATIARFAPNSKELAFSGSGQRLGGSETKAPVIQWGSASASASANASASAKAAPSAAETVAQKVEAAVSSVEEAVLSAEAPASSANGGEEPKRVAAVDDAKKAQLMEMGFSELRAVKALVRTRENGSVEAAAEWIFEHMDDADIDEPLAESELQQKPTMTQEEQRAKALELLEKARVKRVEEEKAREVEREKNRIKSGKEVAAAKAKYDEEQRRRDIAARKKEKADALAEKQRLRDLLKQDQEARRLKFAPRAAPVDAETAVVATPGANSAASAPASGQGTIQLRLPDGGRLEGHFDATQTVGDVLEYMFHERPDLGAATTLELVSTYPRRVFRASDRGVVLAETALLPRGALTVRFV